MARNQDKVLKRNTRIARAGLRASHVHWFLKARRDELRNARKALQMAGSAFWQSPAAAIFLAIVYPHLVINHVIRDGLAMLSDEAKAFERGRASKAA